jgi:hypothetical protein
MIKDQATQEVIEEINYPEDFEEEETQRFSKAPKWVL